LELRSDGAGQATIVLNSFTGNGSAGIRVASGNNTIHQNNFFGNGGGCGMDTAMGTTGNDAAQNFWGTSGGPGINTADHIADNLCTSTLPHVPVAAREFRVRPPQP
jgi:parallel beta-helix repeat protein